VVAPDAAAPRDVSVAAPSIRDAAHGIHTIDTGFHRPAFDAAYLIVEDGRGAFVDCGTNHSVPTLLATLAAAGLDVGDVDWLIPTHVHLDHAGGAGRLMHALPNARVLAHPRAAPHLVDPAKLIAGATAVYGEAEIARSYGRIEPVPAARVEVSHDGMVLDFHGRALRLIDTPGHARHHHCLFDERSRSWFTGDTFGISYRELDSARGPFLFPTTTPVQFEPDALKASIARLMQADPVAMYLTHYGRIDASPAHAAALIEQIDAMVALARGVAPGPQRHTVLRDALREDGLRRIRAHGCTLGDDAIVEVIGMDLELNAQGLGVWLDRAA
jgi:glyoxylase-like metal-dependent hydrolase (beta-lactamase superfamily II)